MKRVKYIGHIVTKEGIHADPQKVDKVRACPIPKFSEDVWQPLGFAGYYRKFIQNFFKGCPPFNKYNGIWKKPRGKQKLPTSSWI